MWKTKFIAVLLALYISGCTNSNGPLQSELETFQRSDDYDYGITTGIDWEF